MDIKACLFTIETEFNDNWGPELVQFGSSPARPIEDSWILLDVAALSTDEVSFKGCRLTTHMAYITCYAPTRAKAADIADRVAAFLEGRQIGDYFTSAAEPVHQADVDSTSYFYRIRVPIRN